MVISRFDKHLVQLFHGKQYDIALEMDGYHDNNSPCTVDEIALMLINDVSLIALMAVSYLKKDKL